ncbi:ABC transporter substrate-binding protein [Pseudonocardia kunmingensis]|uniref:Carbohydrate ABC transporter substrate-binding protein (CUT1 family) n=1 Tax=Pseudonocardia kunmingensis TaxID=630975 RepID=A0A543D437_9PSEU|nr:sugar ABC transporter substrate-binding protein [Pseudonocardia kunmingensis]TQM04099.1 carbohydrate ABC transporter substrate-binding protein (CUT1 family) [Pseudonocardia kunmingensis]
MTRTRTLAALGAALAVALVPACAAERPPAERGGWNETGEVTYWMWDATQLPAYQQCADDFEARNPEIDIAIEQVGWDDYWGRMLTGFVANAAPDVFVNHTSKYGDYTARGLIEPLDELVARDGPDLSQFVEGTGDLWVGDDGKRYGLPKDFDAVGIFYNAGMAAEAGITPEQMQNLTWNPQDGGTYEDVLARLSVDVNGVRGDEPGFDPRNVATYGLGISYPPGGGSGQTQWSMYTATLGWSHTDKPLWGTHFHYDDPRFQDTIAWWRSLIDKGYMPPVEQAVGNEPAQLMQAGRVALVTEGSWNIATFAKLGGIELATAATPIGPQGYRAAMTNSLADSISAGSPNKGAAWKWVRYLASPECQSVVAQGGVVVPAIASVVPAAEARIAESGLDITPFTRHLREGTAFPFPAAQHAADVDEIMGTALERVMAGSADPSSFTAANDEVNALFTQG